MSVRNLKQKSASAHNFAMVPSIGIPRSSFRMESALKTAFSAADLVPIYLQEMLPGDSFNVTVGINCRTAIPQVPVFDNWTMETFFFAVPMRILWNNAEKFWGEQANPGDSTSYVIPYVQMGSGYGVGSLQDYFGLPTVGQFSPGFLRHSALPLRAYNEIYNEWFRDQNLQNSVPVNKGDGPDNSGDYVLLKRGKRHDYFTGCLPFLQKGTAATVPIGTSATVRTSASNLVTGAQASLRLRDAATGNFPGANLLSAATGGTGVFASSSSAPGTVGGTAFYPENLYADLSTATASTVNQLRQAFQYQRMLEREARGGTRYTEWVRTMFGVTSPDARLQRPEYLGGGRTPVILNAVPQTSATGLTGATTPLGSLAASGQAQGRHGFSYAATEHCYILGLINVRVDLTYQQGISRLWTRSTKLDFYQPVFANLGEQAVLNREIYVTGSQAQDEAVFGYQERWAEYRYAPSRITGIFKSTSAGTIDYWHSAQRFSALPTLNATFITDASDIVLQRNFTGGAQTAGQQFLCDIFFSQIAARPMPMYSVPGMIDHL